MAVLTTRIEYAADQPPSFLARWGSRIAFFSVMLLVAALVLHRVFSLPTPFAMNLAGTAFAGAILVLAMAGVAALDIWMTGRQGAARVVVAGVLALGLLSLPVMAWIASRDWPAVTDISTDLDDPPAFKAALSMRGDGANTAEYQKDPFAALQAKGYPDIKTLAVPRSVEDTFDVVLQALTKLKLKPHSETAPADDAEGEGLIELSDRTMILGFRDDVAIRVRGDETGSEVDVRSSSRYGRMDFGRNATRVREIMKEIVGRLEATVPSARTKPGAEGKAKDKKKGTVKRPGAGGRPSAADRPRPRPSQPATRRAPGPSASPPE